MLSQNRNRIFSRLCASEPALRASCAVSDSFSSAFVRRPARVFRAAANKRRPGAAGQLRGNASSVTPGCFLAEPPAQARSQRLQAGPTPAPRLRPGRMRARSRSRAFGAPRPGNRTPGRRLNAARPEPECAETPRADGIYADIYEGDIRPRAVFAPRKTLRGAGRQRARLPEQKPTAPEPECRSGRRKQG